MSEATHDGKQRLDVWLWHARLARTRSKAQALCATGCVTVNGAPVTRPATLVRIGDDVAITVGRNRRILKVVSISDHRGNATQAASLRTAMTAERLNPLDV